MDEPAVEEELHELCWRLALLLLLHAVGAVEQVLVHLPVGHARARRGGQAAGGWEAGEPKAGVREPMQTWPSTTEVGVLLLLFWVLLL